MIHTIMDQKDIDYCKDHLDKLKLGVDGRGKEITYSFNCKRNIEPKSYNQVKLYFAWIRFVLMSSGYSRGDANKYSESFHIDLKKIISGRKGKNALGISVGGNKDRKIELIPSIKGFDKEQMRRYMEHVKNYIEPEFELTLPLPEDRFIDKFMKKYGERIDT